VGGFSTAFDLISSEYGWTDEQIFDLSLARMQQIVATIKLRRLDADANRKRELSWSTRHIAKYISAGYMTDYKKGLESAQKIALEEIERKIIEADIPEPIPEIEPKAGSYEKLLMAFGGPPR
jgi:hypothetical protein